MHTVVKGKNIEVSSGLRRYVEARCAKLPRYLENISSVEVELSAESTRSARTRQVVQVTVNANGTLLRAEVRADDMFSAVDSVMDKIRRQVRSYKDRLYNRAKIAANRARPPEASPAEELAATEEAEESGEAARIVKIKRFLLKPLAPEEAVDQMELLGHDFFMFTDRSSELVNVVYRRRDGTYGLLIPELG
jgi:putative sigma-54 modulation protein